MSAPLAPFVLDAVQRSHERAVYDLAEAREAVTRYEESLDRARTRASVLAAEEAQLADALREHQAAVEAEQAADRAEARQRDREGARAGLPSGPPPGPPNPPRPPHDHPVG